MLPIRTILVPADFSDGSTSAFGLAQALARDYGARIVVAHVVEPPRATGVEGVLVFQPEVNWESFRQRLVERYRADAAIPIEHIVVEGYPAEEIARLAGDYHADVIVIGTHGRTGLSRLIMGSVAEQVLRRAPCPVVTIKHPTPAGAHLPTDEAEMLAVPAGANGGVRP
jgi:nucleotide-binding universal stress UspA family protein